MHVGCCVLGCGAKRKPGSNLLLFRFPRDLSRRKKWHIKLKRPIEAKKFAVQHAQVLKCAPDTLSVVRMIKLDFVKILPRRSNSDSSKICPFAVIFIISMCFFRRTI